MRCTILARLRPADDRGSLAVAMLVSLVGSMLAVLLLTMLVGQVRTSRDVSDRVRALHAAQAGLDTAMAGIRAAEDGTDGRVELLPCGPIPGSMNGGKARFDVTIDYLLADPKGKSDTWVLDNRIKCISGSGAFKVPAFALLRARGTNLNNVRELRATYTFKTTNEAIAGGLIRGDWPDDTTNLCMDAGASSPNPSTAVRMQVCKPSAAQQTWAYETNLTIRLVSSKIPSRPLGLCLDAGAAQTVGQVVTMQPCGGTTQPHQQWGYNWDSMYEGSVNTAACIGLPGGVEANSVFTLVKCSDNASKGAVALRPDSKVGAGAAGEDSQQLVNFDQFGRCLDVPIGKVSIGYMVSWQCKQAADPADLDWNQRWTIPADGAAGKISVTKTDGDLGTYCLTSPAATNPTAAAGLYPSLVTCPASIGTDMRWRVTRKSSSYATSYRIEDAYGYCAAPSTTEFYDKEKSISKVVMQKCSGSTIQKWNAPPDIGDPAYKDISEE